MEVIVWHSVVGGAVHKKTLTGKTHGIAILCDAWSFVNIISVLSLCDKELHKNLSYFSTGPFLLREQGLIFALSFEIFGLGSSNLPLREYEL